MNTSLRKIIISCIALLAGLAAYTQTFSATYGYDANGNRTSVITIYMTLKSATVTTDSTAVKDSLNIPTSIVDLPQKGWQKGIDDPGTGFGITLYPNPTYGKLLVEISGLAAEQMTVPGNGMWVYNVQGAQVLSITNMTTYNAIDMTDKPAGIYIMKLRLNGQVKEYRIVKE
jgi:hypothetical protein